MSLPADYHNRVICGDVMEVLKVLPDGCVDIIYSDPDYNVGIKYNERSYTMPDAEYNEWYGRVIKESMRVLSPHGNLFTINYPRQNAYLWVNYLDELAYQVNEYAWVYNTSMGASLRKFTTAHRSILHATKSKDNNFYKEQVAQPYQNPNDKRIRKQLEEGSKGRMPYSWFYFDQHKNVTKDKTIHPCQIPLGLAKLLFSAAGREGDSVMVLFGGSGGEVKVAQDMGMDYLCCEIDEEYCKLIEARLKSSAQLNLNKYYV